MDARDFWVWERSPYDAESASAKFYQSDPLGRTDRIVSLYSFK